MASSRPEGEAVCYSLQAGIERGTMNFLDAVTGRQSARPAIPSSGTVRSATRSTVMDLQPLFAQIEEVHRIILCIEARLSEREAPPCICSRGSEGNDSVEGLTSPPSARRFL